MIGKIFISAVFLMFTLTNLQAASFDKKASKSAILLQEGFEKNWDPVSGMKLENYYKTNHAAKLKNGLQRQYASLDSLISDNKEFGIDEKTIKVIDVSSEKFINASKAFYVIGSKVKGTMSQTSKLAFLKEEDAKKFQKKFGGELVNFFTALDETKKNFDENQRKLKILKEKKIYPMGEKIYKRKCIDIDPNNYIEISELKAEILKEQLCSGLKEKHLQAVALYLWEKTREPEQKEHIEVGERERCPVCGMFVAKYPRWVAQIIYNHKDHTHKFSFDGAKDMMKFYFNPKKWGDYPVDMEHIKEIKVTDYYSQKPIEGREAFYVIGSTVYGPMGNELIPFENKKDAIIFKKDHSGTKILKFDEIVEKEVYKLDVFKK